MRVAAHTHQTDTYMNPRKGRLGSTEFGVGHWEGEEQGLGMVGLDPAGLSNVAAQENIPDFSNTQVEVSLAAPGLRQCSRMRWISCPDWPEEERGDGAGALQIMEEAGKGAVKHHAGGQGAMGAEQGHSCGGRGDQKSMLV